MKAFVFLLLLCPLAFAESITSSIHEIDLDQKDELHLIKMNSGRVVFVSPKQIETLKQLHRQWRDKSIVVLQVDDKNQLISSRETGEKEKTSQQLESEDPFYNYEPTVVAGMDAAQSIFSRMRRNYQKESQCFNRAHIWTFEEFKRSGLHSSKIFLFFTNRYIRSYRFHWWFHVSPMITVADETGVSEKVIDRRYTKGPLPIKAWTDVFVYSHRNCPVAAKYSDYRKHQSVEHCYIMPRSMYFYHPSDMNKQERSGTIRTEFGAGRINEAYREAF